MQLHKKLVSLIIIFSMLSIIPKPAAANAPQKEKNQIHHIRYIKLKKEKIKIVNRRRKLMRAARSLLGTRYSWGGSSRYGIDCSGLTQYVYRKIGIYLPHLAYSQWRYGRRVSKMRNLKRGDLVFFNNLGHVGLYIGNGKMIAASSGSGRVRVSDIGDSWFAYNYDGGKRLIYY